MKLKTIIQTEPEIVVKTDDLRDAHKNMHAAEAMAVLLYGEEVRRTWQFESMLFIDRKSPLEFGDLPHNFWGVCQGYHSEGEAIAGHTQFVALVKAELEKQVKVVYEDSVQAFIETLTEVDHG